MAHRFNQNEKRKIPKKSANERTLSRWRLKHNLENTQDEQRITRLEELKQKIRDNIIRLTKGKKKADTSQ